MTRPWFAIGWFLTWSLFSDVCSCLCTSSASHGVQVPAAAACQYAACGLFAPHVRAPMVAPTIQDPPLEVPVDGGPGWISNLDWLPLRLSLRVHSSISSGLSIQSDMLQPVLDPDTELARVILAWANTETGSRVKDFGDRAVALRLLDGFGAFPATRMIALAHALDCVGHGSETV